MTDLSLHQLTSTIIARPSTPLAPPEVRDNPQDQRPISAPPLAPQGLTPSEITVVTVAALQPSATPLPVNLQEFCRDQDRTLPQLPEGRTLFSQVYTLNNRGRYTLEPAHGQQVLDQAQVIKTELLNQPDMTSITSFTAFQERLSTIARDFPRIKELLILSGPSFPEPGKGLTQKQLWLNQVLTSWQSEELAEKPLTHIMTEREIARYPATCTLTSEQSQVAGFVVETASTEGRRSGMEDAHHCGTLLDGQVSYFGLFDGHGGIGTADACANLETGLHQSIAARLRALPDLNDTSTVSRAINQAFTDFAASLPEGESGSTALVCLQIGNKVYTASLGDSRALIKRADGAVEQLSYDQKFDQAQELTRMKPHLGNIVNSVFSGTSLRVADPDDEEGTLSLAMPRTFGDKRFPGISSTPFISVTTINPGDSLILGCDGVWDAVRNQDTALISTSANPAATLVTKAYNARSADNISVITATFTPSFLGLEASLTARGIEPAETKNRLISGLQAAKVKPFVPPKGVGFFGKFFGTIGLVLLSLTGLGLFASIPLFIALFKRPATPLETNLRKMYDESKKLLANINTAMGKLQSLSADEILDLNVNMFRLKQNIGELQLCFGTRSRMFSSLKEHLTSALGETLEKPNPFYLLGMDPEMGVADPLAEAYWDNPQIPKNDPLRLAIRESRQLTRSPLARESVVAELRGEPTDPGFSPEDIEVLRKSGIEQIMMPNMRIPQFSLLEALENNAATGEKLNLEDRAGLRQLIAH